MKKIWVCILTVFLASCGSAPQEPQPPTYVPPRPGIPTASVELLQSDFSSAYYSTCDAKSGSYKTFNWHGLLDHVTGVNEGLASIEVNVAADKALVISFKGYTYRGSCKIEYAFLPEEDKHYKFLMDEQDGDYCVPLVYEIQPDGTNVDIKKKVTNNLVPCNKLEKFQSPSEYTLRNEKYRLCKKLPTMVWKNLKHTGQDSVSKKRVCQEILAEKTLIDAIKKSTLIYLELASTGNSPSTYISQLTYAGERGLTKTAQAIYSNGEMSTVVLDLVAEALLLRYKGHADYISNVSSWLARALGQSGNGRYYSMLVKVANETSDKKLRKWVEISIKQIGAASGAQYEQSMVEG